MRHGATWKWFPKTAETLDFIGDPSRIRTCNPRSRNPLLQAASAGSSANQIHQKNHRFQNRSLPTRPRGCRIGSELRIPSQSCPKIIGFIGISQQITTFGTSVPQVPIRLRHEPRDFPFNQPQESGVASPRNHRFLRNPDPRNRPSISPGSGVACPRFEPTFDEFQRLLGGRSDVWLHRLLCRVSFVHAKRRSCDPLCAQTFAGDFVDHIPCSCQEIPSSSK